MKLQGHHGEVWSLALAQHGAFVVSASHDRSIRIWEKTDEQVSPDIIKYVAILRGRTRQGAG